MKQSILAISALSLAVAAQDVTWCKDSDCGDCPSGLTSSGPGYPECVVYDSNVVFGGQGFEEGTEKIKYNVWGNFADPCGGQPGSYIVRSPASLTVEGCGNIKHHSENAECSGKIGMEDTFMVQFCCGSGDCQSAGVPWGKRDGSGMQTARLKWANGTEIEPLAVGSPPNAMTMRHGLRSLKERKCDGYQEGSYEANGEPYLKTFDTRVVSPSVAAAEEERQQTITYDQSETFSTSFELSVGDPLGIVSASVGFEFSTSETNGYTTSVTIPAGVSGQIGFTPVFQCTKGTLLDCDDVRSDESESCTPYTQSGIIQGDYQVIQT